MNPSLFIRRISKFFLFLRFSRKIFPYVLQGCYPSLEHYEVLKGFEFSTIVDCGSNFGQFIAFSRIFYPNATIFAFEPLPYCYNKINNIFSLDSFVTVSLSALGDAEGSSTFFESFNSGSSSILPIEDMHINCFPGTQLKEESIVCVTTLDSYFSNGSRLVSPSLLKLDVQGYELAVLSGCTQVLNSFDFIICEITFKTFYSGQCSPSSLISFLLDHGFTLVSIYDPIYVNGFGYVQVDTLWKRGP